MSERPDLGLGAETFMAMIHGAMLSARAQDSPEIYRSVAEAVLRRITAGS